MPRHRKTKKDATTCEKLRRVGRKLWPADVRMGKPDMLTTYHTNPGNWNILVPGGKERESIPSVAASESGRAQTKKLGFGVTKNHDEEEEVFGMAHLRGWKSRIRKRVMVVTTRVGRGTWNPVWMSGDHSVRLNTLRWPIVNQYREGKVKRTPGGEWKESETVCLQDVRDR